MARVIAQLRAKPGYKPQGRRATWRPLRNFATNSCGTPTTKPPTTGPPAASALILLRVRQEIGTATGTPGDAKAWSCVELRLQSQRAPGRRRACLHCGRVFHHRQDVKRKAPGVALRHRGPHGEHVAHASVQGHTVAAVGRGCAVGMLSMRVKRCTKRGAELRKGRKMVS